MTIFEQFLSNTAKSSGQMAYTYLGKGTSYADLRVAIAKLSYLYQNELGPSARVALIARNSPAWIKTFFSLTNIRATVVPIDPESPMIEWAALFKEFEPTHVLITSDLLNQVREFLSSERLVTPIVEIEKKQGGEYDSSFTAPSENKPLDTDVILMLRTGGHGGTAKLVQFTHKQLQTAASSLKSSYKPLPTDRLLTTLSWAHPFSFVHGMLFPLMSGFTALIDHGLQGTEFFNFLTESRVTRLVGTPPAYMKLILICRHEGKPLVGIKSATVGLGALSDELRRVFQLMKIATPHVYGMTENLWTIAMESVSEDQPTTLEPGVHGKALPGMKYKVMDENGDEIEGTDSRTGSLAVSGPTMMLGYFGEEHEMETKSMIRGTWLYTGDFARLEGEKEDLKISFIGRKEDLINIEGQWTMLEELDHVLRKLPGLHDAAAFACKTSKNQIVPVCAIVKTQGALVNEKTVIDHCTKHLSADFVPKAVLFTDAIPRDSGGNVNYHKLRAQFSGAAG